MLTFAFIFTITVREKHQVQEGDGNLSRTKPKPEFRRPAPHQPANSLSQQRVSNNIKPLPEVSILAILVLMSGCAALIMQVAWMRELRLVFGATTASAAAVLAIFMAGLGLGSAILGRWADRVLNPLALYGWFEIGIAISAAMSPALIAWISSMYLALGGQQTLGLGGATFARLGLAAIVMAVPTFLMGGTLPAVVRSATPRRDLRRRGLGMLYGANTMGAVLGSAAATFYFLETYGTRWTLWSGCCLGLLAGTLAIIKSRQILLRTDDDVDEENPRALADISQASSVGTRSGVANTGLIYVTAGVVGCAFFALEIVWYRMLAPILGGTTYTFGLILCMALAGIGLGGLLYHLLFRFLRPTMGALAVTLACEACLAVVPYALGDQLAIWTGGLTQAAQGFGALVWGWVLIAGIVALPVALVSGVQFPLLIALLGQGRSAVSRHIGTTYAWNTAGAIGGSLLAGFGGLPWLGALGLWCAVAIALALMAIVVLALAVRQIPSMVVASCFLAVAVGCMFATGPTSAWRHSGIGASRTYVPVDDANQLRQWANGRRRAVIWEADGIESSVGLVTHDGLSFFVNGKNDGNALRDAPTQMGMAILGAVLHPQPTNALVIGLGTGETAGWLAEMRGIESVEVVEIEPAVDEMARRTRRLNWDVLNHPRVRRIYNDAREHILTARQDYDVIISEPSNPYRAGIATLYTQEFYRAVSNRLRDNGVFVQFVQAYEIDVETVEIVLATIRSVFPHVEVWQTGRSDMQLICYKRTVTYDAEEMARRLECPQVREAMRRAWHTEGVAGFFTQLVASAKLAEDIHSRPHNILNTDDRTVLEYRFAKTVGMMTPFSLDALRVQMAGAGLHRVPFSGPGPDWELVELLQHETSLMHRSFFQMSLVTGAEQRKLAQAFHHYDQQDYAATVAVWPAAYRSPRSDVQLFVLAHALAEMGNDDCLTLIAEATSRRPKECAAVRAIYHYRNGAIAAAAEELTTLFQLLHSDPWMMTVFLDPALVTAVEVARADAESATRLATALANTFAEYRYEPYREQIRIRVAQHASETVLAAAFDALEPHPEWTEEMLSARAAAYRAVGHPLAAQAEKDWQWFQRHKQSPAEQQP